MRFIKGFFIQVKLVKDAFKAAYKGAVLAIGSELGMASKTMLIGGGLLTAVSGIVVTIIVLARAIPVLWPLATEASANITAMEGTDAGTTTIVAFWPVVLLIVGLGVAIGLIVYALKRFNILS